jgi:hypothetical protein
VSLLRRASGEETIETGDETIFPAGEDIPKSSFGNVLRMISDGVRSCWPKNFS